jgi:hypothetical protein
VLFDHFRQAGVTPHLSLIYLHFRSRNFIFGGSAMNSTIPADLLELKARFETWRTNRKYMREPIPDEPWSAAADLSRRYPLKNFQLTLKIRSRILLTLRRQAMSLPPCACPTWGRTAAA